MVTKTQGRRRGGEDEAVTETQGRRRGGEDEAVTEWW